MSPGWTNTSRIRPLLRNDSSASCEDTTRPRTLMASTMVPRLTWTVACGATGVALGAAVGVGGGEVASTSQPLAATATRPAKATCTAHRAWALAFILVSTYRARGVTL